MVEGFEIDEDAKSVVTGYTQAPVKTQWELQSTELNGGWARSNLVLRFRREHTEFTPYAWKIEIFHGTVQICSRCNTLSSGADDTLASQSDSEVGLKQRICCDDDGVGRASTELAVVSSEGSATSKLILNWIHNKCRMISPSFQIQIQIWLCGNHSVRGK